MILYLTFLTKTATFAENHIKKQKTMKYDEIKFTYHSSIENSVVNDILAFELGNIGFDSFMETDEGLLGYITTNTFDETKLKKLLESFPFEQVEFNYTIRPLEDKDWNEEWEKNSFQPIKVGHECIIRAPYHKAEAGYKYEIIIDPQLSFGTGHHQTTYLMIEELLKLNLIGKKVLDMGCGTAILAILARMKGADDITAIDIDKWAYKNAIKNIELNGIDHIQVALGGAEKIASFDYFDIILANINRNILLHDIHQYAAHLKSEGQLYMSGFYKEDIPLIEAESKKYGLQLQSFTEKDNWVAVRFQRQNIN
jgi:ribosomal protein L11 methyltransferase